MTHSFHSFLRRILPGPRAVQLLSLALVLGLLPLWSAPNATAAPTQQDGSSAGDDDEEIVYLGDDGVIRVIDPNQPDGVTPVVWFSPDADLDGFALGDFTNDEDIEIVAFDTETNRLVIYDPVAAAGSRTGNDINGVPWDILYEETLPGPPTVVGAGDMDAGIAGDEILYGYSTGDERSIVKIIKPTMANPDGRAWQDHITGEFQRDWDKATIGDINETGSEEVLLLDTDDDDDDGSSLAVLFDLEQGFGINPVSGDGEERTGSIWSNFTSSDQWLDGAIGQVYDGGPGELAIIRRTNKTGFLLLRYDDDRSGNDKMDIEDEDDAILYLPSPESLFLADVNGSGDDEVFILRPSDFNGQARLIMQKRGGDGTIDIESSLNNTNYDTGVGADIDGDDRDELILMRDEGLLVFTEADRSLDPSNTYNVDTDGKTIGAANLNRVGFQTGPLLETGQASVEASIPTGTISDQISVSLRDASQNAAVPVSFSVSANATWARVSLASSQTPTTLQIRFDATNLPPGAYAAEVTITSSNDSVVNQPYSLPLLLTVEPAAVELSTNAVSFTYPACETPEPRSRTLRVSGTPNVLYTATLVGLPTLESAEAALGNEIASARISADGATMTLSDRAGNATQIDLASSVVRDGEIRAAAANVTWPSSVPWATAESSGRVPDELTISVDPVERSSNFEQAILVLVADSSAGSVPDNVTLVPVSLICAQAQVYLPLLSTDAVTR